MFRRIALVAVCASILGGSALAAEKFELLTGVDQRLYPGIGRTVVPIPGPGIPGTFYDGDRLAGTSDAGPVVAYQGIGTPMFEPNEFGSLSFMFRRGTVPLGPPGVLPFMGIEFLGGPLLDLDGDLNNGSRSFVPVQGEEPVVIPGSTSSITLSLDPVSGTVALRKADITGNNEGGPGIGPEIATILVTLAGTGPHGEQNGPINPGVDTRVGTLTPYTGTSGTLRGVSRIEDLGFELWEDTVSADSSSADWLGTLQFLGNFEGWLVTADSWTGQFPALAGEGLGSTRWPAVDASQVGNAFNVADPNGGTATISDRGPNDIYTAPNNGGLPLVDFGGDLGAYLDAVVVPQLPPDARRFVYLQCAGFGINNSFDPVYGDTVSYDIVIVAVSRKSVRALGNPAARAVQSVAPADHP